VGKRPSFLDHQEGEGNIVECVDYLISLLVKHAPSEMTSEHPPEGKPVEWIIRSFPGENICFTEISRRELYRPFLARIAWHYMEGEARPYGGFTRLKLTSSGREYSAAIYLANDGLCGFWFKGMCVPMDQKNTGITAQNI
jgi:hypothetical protein